MDHLFSLDSLVSFIVLVILEIVLGIDNVIFVSLILNRIKQAEQKKARLIWMLAGITMRGLLLFALTWLLAQNKVYYNILGKNFNLSGFIMLGGGLFLIYKSVKEIHEKLEGDDHSQANANKTASLSFGNAVLQIILIDTVFSFDSIITAGGTAKHLEIMIAAVVLAMIVMFLFSPKIAAFIHRRPTLKMLALCFLVMIGFTLLVEGWNSDSKEEMHLKNYVYVAMGFALIVEILNMRLRKGAAPVELREPMPDQKDPH
jgi:predicted tellurium resistance membrane protein TerC